VVANCDHFWKLRYSPNLPYAFTEHEAIMLATVLNSPVAVSRTNRVRQFNISIFKSDPSPAPSGPAFAGKGQLSLIDFTGMTLILMGDWCSQDSRQD